MVAMCSDGYYNGNDDDDTVAHLLIKGLVSRKCHPAMDLVDEK